MKTFRKFQSLICSIALTLCVACAPLGAQAATTNIPVAIPGVVLIPLQLDGQFTATVNPVVKFILPFGARLIGVSANARASGGTSPTLTVDVEDDGTSVLSSAIAITAGTPAEGTVANPAIADESVIEVILTIGGTSPTWNDITVLLTVVRT